MKDIEKVKNAYRVSTNLGTLCLKRLNTSRYKKLNASIVAEALRKNNFLNIPRYIRTKNGHLFSQTKKSLFYAEEWIDGEECNFNEINDATNYVILLAHSSVS
ncbi:hypothetical protein M2651_06415 [Clostridium sp. SYSU_GA19001]|uniref:hypothetical protein n=1 Tax=Clostridium caldaquaticum TaxID=2940653 RepID=UPI0020770702|nr:hypothetical protein [Clostridium caldaquaticum]MCM8710662.1 hypothetical protein [Clostridium caldaquaticum]